MRRSDREIKDFDEIVGVLKKCEVCRLALNGDGYPYIVPLNFGIEVKEGTVVLYFHSATEGTKLDLIKKDNRATFEADCCHRLVFDEEKGNCTAEYESVIGRGRISAIEDPIEKTAALRTLVAHYREEGFPFSEAVVPMTAVFCLVAEEITGKRKKKKKS